VSTAADDLALEFAERAPETTRSRLLTWQDPLPTAAAGAEMAGIDYMRAFAAGELPPPPPTIPAREASRRRRLVLSV
jgi:hypothetical protein